jgi:hypothetical protein
MESTHWTATDCLPPPQLSRPRGVGPRYTSGATGALGETNDGLERALRIRPLPSSVSARLGFLLRLEKGSTKGLAGVSQRTVERWMTSGSGAAASWGGGGVGGHARR